MMGVDFNDQYLLSLVLSLSLLLLAVSTVADMSQTTHLGAGHPSGRPDLHSSQSSNLSVPRLGTPGSASNMSGGRYPPSRDSSSTSISGAQFQRRRLPGRTGSDSGSESPQGSLNRKGSNLFSPQGSMVISASGAHSSSHEGTQPPPKDDSDTESEGSDSSLAESVHEEGEEVDNSRCARIGRKIRALVKKPRKAVALDSNALFILAGDGCLRIFIYNLVHTKIFEGLVIIVILMNSVTLAMLDPTIPNDQQPEWQGKFEIFFLSAFSVEMVLKIFAFGFIGHKGAYLRNPWNVIDFLIVLLSYLALIPGFGNYTALRTLRVLRPLRSMNAIPPLKTIVQGLLYSVIELVNVLLLMGFIFTIFGIVAVQLWMGVLRNRCQHDETENILEEYYCTDVNNTLGGLRGRHCPVGYSCRQIANPNYGFTSFDNILWAFLVIIQVITLEGWGLIMFAVMDAWGWPAAIYFVLLILVGSYFVLNLALAVINHEFIEAKERILREDEQAAREEAVDRIRLDHQQLARGRSMSRRPTVNMPMSHIRRPSLDPSLLGPASMNASGMESDSDEDSLYASTATPPDSPTSQITGGSNQSPAIVLTPTTGALDIGEDVSNQRYEKPWTAKRILRKFRRWLFFIVEGDPELYGNVNQTTTLFTKFIVLCIFCNTVVLAAEHHGQSEIQNEISTWANFVFTIIFGIEFVLKLIALNPVRYIKDGFNVLDGLIVIISFVELGLGGDGTFTVFRAFRLLRVFKLLKNFPSLRSIVEVMLNAVQDTGYLNIIILLYLFIAALMGMQLFGGQLSRLERDDADLEPIRSTFDSFLRAFYTVFQIMTRDSWPDLMWLTMRATNEAASLYFLFCVVTGDFIILNLFLAILISSFDRVGEAEPVEHKELAVLLSDGRPVNQQIIGTQIGQLLGRPTINTSTTNKVFPAPPGAAHGPLFAEGVHGQATDPLVSPTNSELGLHSDSSMSGHICPKCQQAFIAPFPTASKSIPQASPQQLHQRMCAAMLRRTTKEKVIRELINEYTGWGDGEDGEEDSLDVTVHDLDASNMADDKPSNGSLPAALPMWRSILGGNVPQPPTKKVSKPTPRRVEEAFGTAWEVGLLLGEDMERYLNIRTWAPIRKLLAREQQVLDLRVGEEQVGRALVAYTSANVPSEMTTNGGTSLWIFGPRNSFRISCSALVTYPAFDQVILLCIGLSSIVMALDNPRDEGTRYNDILNYIQIGFTGVFTIEAIIKIIAWNFVLHPTAYLKDSWNVLDFAIVVISLVSLILAYSGGSGFEFIQVLRTFRALRPLRVINRNRGIKMVVQTLLLSIKGIANVALITVLIYTVFAILGVQLFAGQLHSCNDETIIFDANCTGQFEVNYTYEMANYSTYIEAATGFNRSSVIPTGRFITETLNITRQWIAPDFNFDNTYNSFVTLFVVATLDDWSDVMYAVIDITGTHTAPQRDSQLYMGLFFVVFIIVGSFFLLNMFVGVIIFNFNQVKSQMDGLSLLSSEQKLWVETQRMMLNFEPTVRQKPGKGKLRKGAFEIAIDPRFEVVVGVMIFLNIVFISLNHYDQSAVWNHMDSYSNYFFVGVFAVEAFVKITAFGWRYFADRWNCFDFFLVVISFLELALVGTIETGFRFLILRVFRMLSLIKRAKSVRVLIETLWYSLPSLANIGAFLLLLFFVYSVLGVQIFALVKRVEGLDHHLNFESFQNAFLLLVQVATLDNWGGVMLAVMENKGCGPETNHNGWNDCGTPWAPLYFFSFIVIAGFVMVNLFVAIILDNFSTTMQLNNKRKSKLPVADLKKFADAWATFDEEATWLVETKNFPLILAMLKPPLGIAWKADRVALLQLTRNYSIPEHAGVIHFVETLIPLARKAQGVHFSDEDIREHEDHWRQQFPQLKKLALLRYRQKRCTVDQYLAAAYIQAAFRRRAAAQQVDAMMQEKAAEISEAYDKAGVPEHQRPLLEKYERRRTKKWEAHKARLELVAEYVEREKRRSISGQAARRSSASGLNHDLNMNSLFVPGLPKAGSFSSMDDHLGKSGSSAGKITPRASSDHRTGAGVTFMPGTDDSPMKEHLAVQGRRRSNAASGSDDPQFSAFATNAKRTPREEPINIST